MTRPTLPKTFGKLTYGLRYLINPRFRRLVDHPVFVVGCGHSGTTLMLRILGSHPCIHPVVQETRMFEMGTYHSVLWRFELDAWKAGARRLVEKTPKHILHLREIFALRPQAKVVLMVRDGRDVAVSIRNRMGEIGYGIRRWIDDNEAGRAWWRDPRVMLVRYEDLVADFQGVTTRLFRFLGEEPSAEVADFHRKFTAPGETLAKPPDASAENHLAHRMWQVTQPLFDGSRRWEKEMSAEERVTFKVMCGGLLHELGYAAPKEW